MELIDRTLAKITFQTETDWIECYLRQDSLTDKPYTVVERHEKTNHGFTLTEYDDATEALIAYDAARVRVKASIAKALDTDTYQGA